MSKVLVIKGANFSANKVDTVEFDRIHTTGLTITDASVSLTSLGDTHTIAYTITPSNSEDPIAWSSSDTSVCTVSDAGVVTATGCGTATITATSNSISATCTVTATILLDGYIKAPRTYIAGNSSSGHAPMFGTYLGTTATGYDTYMVMVDTDSTKTKLNCAYNLATLDSDTNTYVIPDSWGSSTGEYRIIDQIGYVVPIELPANCQTIRLTALNEHYAPCVLWHKSDTRAGSDNTSQYYYSAYKIACAAPNKYAWVYAASTDATVESGYDSFVIIWNADTANGATSFADMSESDLAQFTVTCL